jgi:hypothetical protein
METDPGGDMTLQLSEELRQALAAHPDEPLPVVHPETERLYFLIPGELYERLRPLLAPEPLSQEEQKFLLGQAGRRAGWDDPEMDAYDEVALEP